MSHDTAANDEGASWGDDYAEEVAGSAGRARGRGGARGRGSGPVTGRHPIRQGKAHGGSGPSPGCRDPQLLEQMVAVLLAGGAREVGQPGVGAAAPRLPAAAGMVGVGRGRGGRGAGRGRGSDAGVAAGDVGNDSGSGAGAAAAAGAAGAVTAAAAEDGLHGCGEGMSCGRGFGRGMATRGGRTGI